MSDVFNWKLPPAPGYPGYKPPSQAPEPPQQPPVTRYPSRRQPDIDQSGAAGDESYEPYIPSRADRPYHQWGTPDFALQGAMGYPGIAPGPLMPQMRDIAGLIHNATMGLGRYGSRYTGMPAIAMGTYASAYWNAYQKGMHQRAGDAYQQYRMARQMTIDRGKEEMKDFATVYAKYHDGDKITDVEGYKQDLLQTAVTYQNQSIIHAIANGDFGAVDRILGATDSHISNLIKAQHQEERQKQQTERQRQLDEQRKRLQDAEIQRMEDARKREEERRKAIERERQRYDPSATGPGPDYKPEPVPPVSIPAPETDATPPDTTPPDDTADNTVPSPDTDDNTVPPPDTAGGETDTSEPQRPIQVADASGQVPIGGGTTQPVAPSKAVGFEKSGPEGKPETDPIERAAKDYVFSRKLPPGVEKNVPDIASRMTTRAGQLENWLDRLESDPNINPKDITPAIRKVFPSLADKIEGYLAGKISPSGRAGDPEWRRAIAIANRVNPDFSQGTFQSRQQGLAYWTRGEGGKNLTSLGTAMRHAQTLLDHLSTKPYPYTAGITRAFGGTDTARLDSDISTFAEEYVRAMSGKGPTIPELKEEKERLSLNYPESYLRSLVEERIHLLQTKLREQQDAFTTGTGWPQQDILKRFKAFTDTDPLATNRDRGAVGGLETLQNWAPGGAPSGAAAPASKGKVIDYKDYFK